MGRRGRLCVVPGQLDWELLFLGHAGKFTEDFRKQTVAVNNSAKCMILLLI